MPAALRPDRAQRHRDQAAAYNRGVFINCPYNPAYRPVLRAIVFAVFACNLEPRCALQASNSGTIRVEKIVDLIRGARWGIHDLSDMRTDSNEAPHFNMPLEYGVFFGAHRFGDKHQQLKSSLLLVDDIDKFRKCCSNLGGVDPVAHGGDPREAIKAVRDWVKTEMGDEANKIDFSWAMQDRFDRFHRFLLAFCAENKEHPDNLLFKDLCEIVSQWLIRDNEARSAS